MSNNCKERIDYYIKLVAVNRIKGYIKSKSLKVFPEYDDEVDKYLILGRQKWIEENIGVWT